MKYLYIYASSDPYSHTMVPVKYLTEQEVGGEMEHFNQYINTHKEYFNKRRYSAIHFLMMDLNPKQGQMEILLNEYGEHPLKTRLEINKHAKAAPAQTMIPAPLFAEDDLDDLEDDE